MRIFSRICRAAALLALATAVSIRGEDVKPELYDTLTIGPVTYTNVQVMHRTKADLFLKHPGGLVNVKVKDLDKSTQLQLGYQLAEAAPAQTEHGPRLPEIELDPRVEELVEQVVWESKEFLSGVDRRVFYAAGGVAFFFYLIFCWCCGLICRKAGHEKIGLVWLPLFKQVPLLRAARMSPWWMIANLLPPLFAIGFIVWAFKISKARGKGALTAVLLLLPGINVFAFLYLAFADSLESDDDLRGGRLVAYQQPRRAA